MKAFRKILISTLLVALIITCFALCISASSGVVEAQIDGGEKTVYNSYADFTSAVSAAKSGIKAKLLSDVTGAGVCLTVPTGVSLEFDFAGFSIRETSKTTGFTTTSSSSLTLYSSVPGGAYFAKDSASNGGGPMVKAVGGSTVRLGALADGSCKGNLSSYCACLVDATGSAKVFIEGGSYYRNVSDYKAMLIARNAATYTINDANFINLWYSNTFICAATNASAANATFSFTGTNFIGRAAQDTKLVGTDTVNGTVISAKVDFKECNFVNTAACELETVSYGVGCGFTAPVSNDRCDGTVQEVEKNLTLSLSYNTFCDYSSLTEAGYDYTRKSETYTATIPYMVLSGEQTAIDPEGLYYNLSLYSNFEINLYVPKDGTNIATASGVTGENDLSESKTIVFEDGSTYYVITKAVNANEVDKDVRFYFTLKDEEGIKTLTLSVLDYAKTILSGDYRSATEDLMLSMLAYSNEACKLLDGKANQEISAILEENSFNQSGKVYGEVFELTELSRAFSNAKLNLDATPDFVFSFHRGFDGIVTVSYKSHSGATVSVCAEISEITDPLADPATITVSDLRVYDLNNSITFEIEGVVGDDIIETKASYSLATYARGIGSTTSKAAFASALSCYCEAARIYMGYEANPEAPEVELPEGSDEGVFTKKQAVLLIGQSNMSGRGDLSTVEAISDDRITMMRNYKWVPMVEPIHDTARGGAGIGASFAKAFVETFNCDLGLIPAAEGGTSLADWAVGGDLYNEAVKMAKAAQEDSEICAILWHQGESDQNNTSYAEQLKVIFDAMIEELGLDSNKLVIVTGELFGTRSDAVHRAQLDKLGNAYKNYGVAESDGLLVFDVTTHFDAPSLRVFGYRYFDIFYNRITGKNYVFNNDPEFYRVTPPEIEDDTDYLANHNFNSLAVGTPSNQSNVISYAKKDGIISIEKLTDADLYLAIANGLNSTSGKYTDTYVDIFHKITPGSKVVIEARFKIDEDFSSSVDLFKLVASSGVRTIKLEADGKLYAKIQGDDTYSQYLGFSLSHLEWTDVKIVLDLAENRKTIYVCGVEVLANVAISTSDVSELAITKSRVQFNSGSNCPGTLYVDDYKCYYAVSEESGDTTNDPNSGESYDTTISYIANEGFNSLTAGTTYTANTSVGKISFSNVTANSTVKIVEDGTGDNSVAVTRGSDNKGTYVDVKYAIDASSVVVIEGSFKLGAGAAVGADLLKLTPASGAFNLIYLNTDGKLYDWTYSGGTGAKGEVLGALSSEVWTTIKIICDLKNNVKTVYINGTLVKDNLAVYDTSITDTAITKCRAIQMKAGSGTVYVDNVRYYYYTAK